MSKDAKDIFVQGVKIGHEVGYVKALIQEVKRARRIGRNISYLITISARSREYVECLCKSTEDIEYKFQWLSDDKTESRLLLEIGNSIITLA